MWTLAPHVMAALHQTSREIRDDARAICAESRSIRERSGEIRLLLAELTAGQLDRSRPRPNPFPSGVVIENLTERDIGIEIADIA